MNVIKETKTTDNSASTARAAPFMGAVITDRKGNPLEGEVRLKDGTICRFHNGLLDGNIYDDHGNITGYRPALEYEYGGSEFCNSGKLNGFPAVIQNFGAIEEDWLEGVIQAIRSETELVGID